MKSPIRGVGGTLVAAVAVLLVAPFVARAGVPTGDPVLFTVAPPAQTTAPGTQADVTFTVSDVPPCGSDDLTSLDSLDFALSDPSVQSTIASFTTSEPSGSYASNLSPDMRSLTILFDSAFPCLNGATESISVVVTVNVPAGVPLGTQLTLDGDARGFAVPPNDDYLVRQTATILVQNPPPPPPGNGDGEGGAGGGTGGGAGSAPAAGGTVTAVAATPVRGVARFTG